MKAVVAAFNQEKALVGAFSVITNLRMQLFEALVRTEFLQQMKAALERVRGQLGGEYSAFIAGVDRESQEVSPGCGAGR